MSVSAKDVDEMNLEFEMLFGKLDDFASSNNNLSESKVHDTSIKNDINNHKSIHQYISNESQNIIKNNNDSMCKYVDEINNEFDTFFGSISHDDNNNISMTSNESHVTISPTSMIDNNNSNSSISHQIINKDDVICNQNSTGNDNRLSSSRSLIFHSYDSQLSDIDRKTIYHAALLSNTQVKFSTFSDNTDWLLSQLLPLTEQHNSKASVIIIKCDKLSLSSQCIKILKLFSMTHPTILVNVETKSPLKGTTDIDCFTHSVRGFGVVKGVVAVLSGLS
jgi:hypothetical protein